MKTRILLSIFILINFHSYSQNLAHRVVAKGLDIPWEIIWGVDDHIWVSERPGIVSRINPVNGNKKTILKLNNVQTGSERGLMGMALYDNAAIPRVFLAYTYSDGSTKLRVERYMYDPNADTLIKELTIIENIPGNSTHDGCRLFIEGEKLFITTGDAQNLSSPQNSNSTNGKILRLELDGTIPSDNPIPGNPMWSKGHRNPQGLVIVNGKIYSSEHGPNNDDEVNLITKSGNYGWPDVHGFCNQPSEQTFCADSNVIEPLRAWTPTLAVAGLDYYNHDLIPELKNSLLLVSLKAGKFLQLKLNANGETITSETTLINNTYSRLRDICISPDGRIFIATSNGKNSLQDHDMIIELKPVGVGVEQKHKASIIVFPNPAEKGKDINIKLDNNYTGSYNVVDMIGRIHSKGEFNKTSSFKIESAVLENGIYFISIHTESGTFCEKIIITN